MRSSLLLAGLGCSAAQATQIFLAPPPSANQPVQVQASDAHQILSQHLGMSGFDENEGSAGSWVEELRYDQASPFDKSESDGALLVLISHAESTLNDFLPSSLSHPSLTVASSPTLQSWEALLSLYIKRAAKTFDLQLTQVHGFEAWAKQIAGSAEGVKNWIMHAATKVGLASDITLPVEPKPEYSRLLTQLDFADSSAQTLMAEFSAMDSFVDSLAQGSSSEAQFGILKFEGLSHVEAKHGRESQQYQEASQAFKAMLSATFEAYKAQTLSDKLVVIVTDPTISLAQHYKRDASSGNPLLSPFRFRKSIAKRQKKSSPMPIVPTSKKCFSSVETCESQTDGCNGHGGCVRGISAVQECFVCSCSTAKNGTTYSGQFCEKEDYSSSFFLLVGTALILFLGAAASVSMLYSTGAEDLPQVLELTSGSDGGKKQQ